MKSISVIGFEGRNLAIKGVSTLAKPVKESIGPWGLNHLSDKSNRISNDGAFIASDLLPTIENEFERRGAVVTSENITKINDLVGDFSSTAWAFHEALIKESVRYLPNEGKIKAKKTYSEIAKEIETSKSEVLMKLKEATKPISTREELIQSTLVSVEDEKVAELLGSMQWELGEDGQIIAEEVNDLECSIEKVKGIRLDNGFGTSILVTNPEKQSLEVNNLPILLTNYVIDEPELVKLKDSIFQTLISQKKIGIIIVARAWTEASIKKCQESAQAGFAIFPINAPYVNQTQVMKDIEAVVGGKYIDTQESSLDDVYVTDIGFCERLEARIGDAIITGQDNTQSEERVAKRVEILQKYVEGEKSDFYKKMLLERIAQLTSGFAILKVGATSIADRQRLKDKCDDAVNTVRNNLKYGTVKGAGLAWKEISDTLEEGNILKRPLLCVYEQIQSTAPEDWEIPEWVRDSYWGLKAVIERTCAFVPTFISINSIATKSNPRECKCEQSNG